jgi:hypothetical protein
VLAANASATVVVSELDTGADVPHLYAQGRMLRPHVTITLATGRERTANPTTIILLTMSLGVLIAQIDTSVVNLAVKRIGADFNVGVNMLQWVVDAYNLVYASLLLMAGTLADLYGRRRIFALGVWLSIASIASFAVSSRTSQAANLRPESSVSGLESLGFAAVAKMSTMCRQPTSGSWLDSMICLRNLRRVCSVSISTRLAI